MLGAGAFAPALFFMSLMGVNGVNGANKSNKSNGANRANRANRVVMNYVIALALAQQEL